MCIQQVGGSKLYAARALSLEPEAESHVTHFPFEVMIRVHYRHYLRNWQSWHSLCSCTAGTALFVCRLQLAHGTDRNAHHGQRLHCSVHCACRLTLASLPLPALLADRGMPLIAGMACFAKHSSLHLSTTFSTADTGSVATPADPAYAASIGIGL